MRLIAHRGRRGSAPENSLAGLEGLAPDLVQGRVAGIEIDARLSADDVAVLIHDAALERVSDGRGRVEETRFDALQHLRLNGGDEPPPRMSRYLARAAQLLWPAGVVPGQAGAPVIYLDIKTRDPAQVARIAAEIRPLPFAQGIICLGKTPAMIEAITKAGAGTLRLGLLRCNRDNLAENLVLAQAHRAEVLFVQHGIEAFRDNLAIVPEIRAAGFQAGGSILNGPDALALARTAGCDLVLTDLPEG
ncbi:MAG: hypothetical protein JJU07_06140 [Natronohydrobacter sp.]|nr:hypothetical protein [Natronohydrobacter sp.]